MDPYATQGQCPGPAPSSMLLWATAPDPGVHSYDTLAALVADADRSVLLTEYNVYASLDGGRSWHFSEHRLVPLRADLAELLAPAGGGVDA